MVAAAENDVISASSLGKYKTFSQNVAIIALLVDDSHHLVTDVLIGIAVVLTLYSFVDYAARASRHFVRPAAP